MAAVLAVTLMPNSAQAQQIYRDQASFLAALDELTVESFESFPTELCSNGGSAPTTTIQTTDFVVSTIALDGGTSFLCLGTTSELDPRPTDGNNALIAGSVTLDRWVLTFSFSRPTFAVGFYVTDSAEAGDVLFSTNSGQAVVAQCCYSDSATNVVFFGFINDKPFKTFELTNTGIGDGLGIDEIVLAVRGKPRVQF